VKIFQGYDGLVRVLAKFYLCAILRSVSYIYVVFIYNRA